MSEAKPRNITIDFIKVLAIIGVLAIHIDSSVLTLTPIGSFAWTSGLFWGVLFRASVPLFLMASGALMLDSAKPLSIKKLYFHNILRIVVAMLVWGLAYKIYHLTESGQMSLPMLWYSIKRLLLFDQEFHFYYLHMILIVYIFLPVTRLFAEKADKKLLLYALSVWAVLGVLYPTMKSFKPFYLLSGLTGQWEINLVYSSIGYGLLGYYLKKYPLSKGWGIGCLFVGFAATFGLTWFFSHKNGMLQELFLSGIALGVFLLAVGIFSLAGFIHVKGVLRKIVVYISKASFCIYLSHMFILYTLKDYGIVAEKIAPAIVSVPMLSIFVLFIGLGFYWVLSKIPFINKFII